MNLNNRVANLEKEVHKLKSIHAPRKHDEESVRQDNNASQESKNAPRSVPIIPPAPKNTKQSKDSGDATSRWWNRLASKIGAWQWIKILEITGIIAGIVYAVVTTLQWHDLRHNFEMDQRAWIAVRTNFPTEINDNMAIDRTGVIADNIGKSAALKSYAQSIFTIVDSKSEPPLHNPPAHTGTDISLLFPTDSYVFDTFIYRADGTRRSFSKSEIDSLLAGTSYLVIFVEVTYSDQFGKHWTHRCSWQAYAPESKNFNADSCVAWNAVGDGNPPKDH
jgi:hypothetical protein